MEVKVRIRDEHQHLYDDWFEAYFAGGDPMGFVCVRVYYEVR